MTTAAQVLEEARSYLGTPWVHMGETKGIGVDCIGLLWCTALATGCTTPGFRKPTYGRIPNGNTLRNAVEANCDLVWKRQGDENIDLSLLQDADVALIAWRNAPMHVAWVTRDRRMIHSYADVGKVVEHGIGGIWHKRIVALYRLRGLE